MKAIQPQAGVRGRFKSEDSSLGRMRLEVCRYKPRR